MSLALEVGWRGSAYTMIRTEHFRLSVPVLVVFHRNQRTELSSSHGRGMMMIEAIMEHFDSRQGFA